MGRHFRYIVLVLLFLILDIDDTIKISDVRDRAKLLRHTFIDKHGTPVAGMPELYQSLTTRLSNPTFLYLSAGPWQLYRFVHQFVRTNYPLGEVILRDMSYVELSSFLETLTIGTQEYKEDELQKIHRWLPNKQFICIGDSTQTDPEAYAATYLSLFLMMLTSSYKRFPGWIKAIFIRVVEGVDVRIEKTRLNTPERFATAFDGVPRDVWRTFKDPSELMSITF